MRIRVIIYSIADSERMIQKRIISVSFCAEGTAAVGRVVSLRPPKLGYYYTVIALVRGNMMICSPEADEGLPEDNINCRG